MSDYKPITGELRKVMNHTELRNVPLVELGEYEFARRCDEIDAIHANLERENAALRERLAKMNEQSADMHGGGSSSITDELREWFKDRIFMANGWQEIRDIADRIDAEHERQLEVLYRDMSDAEYVKLPKDTGGEYIRVGDVMERGETHGRVIALMLSNYPKKWGGELHWGIQLEGEHAPTALDLMFHHYHAPTVEDVPRELVDDVRRCCDTEQTIAEYAKRLQLAGDAE